MSDPFRIVDPTVISFSGGRTSGYMLRRYLDSNGGILPANAVVVFCNTGREREQTLAFVDQCSREWNVPIVWLEFRSRSKYRGWDVVDFKSASRRGEPFERLIRTKQTLPNFHQRLCTEWLKVLPKYHYAISLGLGQHNSAVGIRFDEPKRWEFPVDEERTPLQEVVTPLVEARVTRDDVLSFWSANSFDLQLDPDDSNCDLCFLKGMGEIKRVIQADPSRAAWWAEQERWVEGKTGRPRSFRKGLPIVEIVKRVNDGSIVDTPRLASCMCTD